MFQEEESAISKKKIVNISKFVTEQINVGFQC